MSSRSNFWNIQNTTQSVSREIDEFLFGRLFFYEPKDWVNSSYHFKNRKENPQDFPSTLDLATALTHWVDVTRSIILAENAEIPQKSFYGRHN